MGVPATRRALTKSQQTACALLTRYVKDLHETVHGKDSWLTSDDDAMEDIVKALTDTDDLIAVLTRNIADSVRRAKRLIG